MAGGRRAVLPSPPASCMRPAPITRTFSAPRCTAGEIGAVWRIDPSPNHSTSPPSSSGSAGKMKGIADEATRCSIESFGMRVAMRCVRTQGSRCWWV